MILPTDFESLNKNLQDVFSFLDSEQSLIPKNTRLKLLAAHNVFFHLHHNKEKDTLKGVLTSIGSIGEKLGNSFVNVSLETWLTFFGNDGVPIAEKINPFLATFGLDGLTTLCSTIPDYPHTFDSSPHVSHSSISSPLQPQSAETRSSNVVVTMAEVSGLTADAKNMASDAEVTTTSEVVAALSISSHSPTTETHHHSSCSLVSDSHPTITLLTPTITSTITTPSVSLPTSSGASSSDYLGECFVCAKPTSVLCTGCNIEYYCNRECQRKDWITHKVKCKKAKLKAIILTIESQTQYNLACGQFRMGEFVKAYDNWALASNVGHVLSQCKMGDCCRNGTGVAIDLPSSIMWYKKADSIDAHYNLGVIYMEGGKGVNVDMDLSIKWFVKAGDAGDDQSRFNLGSIFFHGVGGVLVDKAKAIMWYKRCAPSIIDAEAFVGFAYCDGEGVDVDTNEGIKRLKKAALRGHEGAIEYLKNDIPHS